MGGLFDISDGCGATKFGLKIDVSGFGAPIESGLPTVELFGIYVLTEGGETVLFDGALLF